ncbi:MAG: hypothetical protein IJU68_04755 [Bacteroidales bacterium]|nr:hypothetical protein [Bacteroidales bacterium]
MKARFVFSTLLLAALAAVSCNKLQDSPEVVILPGDYVVLSASIGAPESKVHFEKDLDSYTNTTWQDGDCIWVRSSTQPYWERGDCFKTNASLISGDGHRADFEGRTRTDGKLCAIYPYNRVLQGSNNDLILIEVPQARTLKQGDCPEGSIVAGACWADGAKSFSMNYLMGAIKFSVCGNGERVSSFVLLDADTSNALWGTLSVTPDYGSGTTDAAMVNDDPAKNRIIMDTDLTLGTEPVDFYFIVPAGSFDKGLVLKAYGPDGKMAASAISGKSNKIETGKVLKMPVITMTPPSGGQSFDGLGVEADPFLIETPEHLCYLSQMLGSDEWASYSDKYYRQETDINMEGVDFSPIGEITKPFKGTYDGNGKVISNLSTSGLSSDNPASGVFGYADSANLLNIKVSNRINTGSFNRVGGIAGYAKNCYFDNCSINGGELKAANNMCGGIVAEAVACKLNKCSASGVKVTNTKNYAGGIVAYAHDGTVISNCNVEDGTEVSSPNEVGGIAGKIEGGSISYAWIEKSKVKAGSDDAGAVGGWVIDGCRIESSYISATEVSANVYAGGAVGLLESSSLDACFLNEGVEVSVTKSGAGGIVGYMKKTGSSTIKSCVVGGESVISGPQNIGGIAGWLDTGTIENCTILGSCRIIASADGVGGIVGRAISKSGTLNIVNSCFVYDNTLVRGSYSVGGIVGYAYPDADGELYIVNCGISGSSVEATSCDTGADPAKGDSMSGGIGGWMRLSDSGSRAYIVNCFSHMDKLVCELPMVHPSVGGIMGYGSVSATGALEVVNCVSSLTGASLNIGGAAWNGQAQSGTVFGQMPNRAVVKVNSCCYIDDGSLSIGSAGANVVLNENQGFSDAEFRNGTTVTERLNAFVASYSGLALKSWTSREGLPVFE